MFRTDPDSELHLNTLGTGVESMRRVGGMIFCVCFLLLKSGFFFFFFRAAGFTRCLSLRAGRKRSRKQHVPDQTLGDENAFFKKNFPRWACQATAF